MNAAAHCYSCHQRLGGDPVVFVQWVRRYLGPVLFDELHKKHNQIKKWTKADKESMYQHYKAELERLKSLRDNGKTGVLELVAYE